MSQRKRSHGGDVRDARRDQPALMRPLEVPVQRKEIRTSVYRKAYRPIDMSLPMRERTCPLLLRVFVSMGHHNDLSAYDIATGLTPTQELPIYTWKDATLRELTGLIQSVIPEARASGAQCSFSLVYPGQTGHYTMRHVGVVSATGAGTDSQTLEQLRFQTGDFMDVALLSPEGVDLSAPDAGTKADAEAASEIASAASLHTGAVVGVKAHPAAVEDNSSV